MVAVEFTMSSTVHEGSLFSISSLTLVICCLFEGGHSDRCVVSSYWDLIFISLMISAADIFSCLLPVCIYSSEKCLFRSLFISYSGLFLRFNYLSVWFVLEITPLLDISFVNIFSKLLFHFADSFLCCARGF